MCSTRSQVVDVLAARATTARLVELCDRGAVHRSDHERLCWPRV